MTEQAPEFGRSYGDIVVAKFRRNLLASAAVILVGLLTVGAIFAPLIASDRPYAWSGTAPEHYRRALSQLVGPAHGTIQNLPARFREDERVMADESEATLAGMVGLLPAEYHPAFHERFISVATSAVAKRITKAHPLRGAYKSRQITLAEMRGLLENDEERRDFDTAIARAREAIHAVYARRMRENIDGARSRLESLASQLEGRDAEKTREFAERYAALGTGDPIRTPVDREVLRALREEAKTELALDRVTLVPRWRYPLFDALNAWDAFFMTAALFWMAAFGPAAWLGLRRLQPRVRRWRVQWSLVLVPACLAAAAWAAFHSPYLETADFKAWPREGKMVVQKAYWAPHAFGPGERDRVRETKPAAAHPMGHDHLGRDLLARVFWGARISLSVGFVSTGIALAIGLVLGAAAGYFAGATDWILSRVTEIWLCFPYFFVILALAAIVPTEGRIFYVMIALGLFQWMTIARLTRGEFLKLRQQEFVAAALALGAGPGRIIFRHILPNAMAPVLVAASFGIAGAILAESGLSFLGFGAQDPDVSWGSILNAARVQPKTWWPLVYPGACIFLSITCYNLIGDAVRDAVDPRLKID